MKCIHCGYIIPDDSEFCPYCGQKLGTGTATTVFSDSSEQVNVDSFYDNQIERERITKSQRYFDSDYGYSPRKKSLASYNYARLFPLICNYVFYFVSLCPSRISASATCIASLMGMAKPKPSTPLEVYLAVTIPTTSPRSLYTGPPEDPELTAASI